jgi:HAD superfamily hydrolase (TIGR01509 family)
MSADNAVVRERRNWLFDLDGTLVDSAPVHAAAFRAALAELAPDRLAGFRYDSHAGATTRDVVAALRLDEDVAAQVVHRKQDVYRGYVDAGRVPVFSGAHRLLDRLAAHGHGVYLVTSGSRGSVTRVVRACGLARHLRGMLTGDDVAAGKPDPAVYREACRRFAVDPADVVVVEDSAHGAASALGAGLLTVLVHAARPVPGTVAVQHLDDLADLFEGVRHG